jgi:UDP-N-acetylmuramate--alanine ligase
MLSVILDRARLDASVLIGGDVKLLGGNARLGNGSTIVTEACEAFGSFLRLWPSIAVITNIDADHLDYYGTIDRVEESFKRFVSQVDESGCVIGCTDDRRVRGVLADCGRRVVWFGFDESADVRAADVDVSRPHPAFTLVRDGTALGEVELNVPGQHNVIDSLAAAAVAFELGLGFEAIQAGLADFHGAGRRFEVLYDHCGVMIVDDYAHHPAELRATLTGARVYGKRIVAVFQPHLYSRTSIFAEDFADALTLADEVIVTSIYAAREKPIDGVSAEMIVSDMRKKGYSRVRYAPEKQQIAGELAEAIKSGDMVLVIGAGDIRIVGEELASILRERNAPR